MDAKAGAQPKPFTKTVRGPARVLLGWVDDNQARLFQTENKISAEVSPEQIRRRDVARSAVNSRAVYSQPAEVFSDVPASLHGHISSLKASPQAKTFFDSGWKIAVADLRKVIALQSHVYLGEAAKRVEKANAADLPALAEITLPIPKPETIPAQYDHEKQAWMIGTQNRNLQITGNFGGPVAPGVVGFGFTVAFAPSFMQVAILHDRFLLRDGYHRALALITKGIFQVPVMIKQLSSEAELDLSKGLLTPEAFLGERPPFLPDYFADSVAVEVTLPIIEKHIFVHGLELSPFA